MNKIILTGNLTADPEQRTTTSGISVCNFTIAVNRKFAAKDGTKTTDFYRVNAWRGLGDVCATYLHKGNKIMVVGELQPRQYETKEGKQGVSFDVAAEEIEFLTQKKSDEKTEPEQYDFTDVPGEELPF